MSSGRDTMADRLPLLLELADELGVPYRVIPWVTRGGGGGEVVKATVRLQVDSGLPDPQEDGGRHGWVEAVNEHDVRAAADRRSRAPIAAVPVGDSQTPPAVVDRAVYRGRRVLPAAEILLRADVNEDLAGAVEIREVEDRRSEDPRDWLLVDELTVDWDRVLDPQTRSTGALHLAQVARSLLEGAPVDLRPALALSGDHAARLAEAMALVARRSLG